MPWPPTSPGTPTVAHFCAVLLLGAILSTPWGSLSNVALAIGAAGLAGVAYGITVVRRVRLQKEYTPDFGDWMWYTVIPLLAYSSLVLAAVLLPRNPGSALFAVGAVALTLLFTGIHDAWDAVTYIALGRATSREKP